MVHFIYTLSHFRNGCDVINMSLRYTSILHACVHFPARRKHAFQHLLNMNYVATLHPFLKWNKVYTMPFYEMGLNILLKIIEAVGLFPILWGTVVLHVQASNISHPITCRVQHTILLNFTVTFRGVTGIFF